MHSSSCLPAGASSRHRLAIHRGLGFLDEGAQQRRQIGLGDGLQGYGFQISAVYHIERRRRDGGEWEQVAHAIATEELLADQEVGVELEFRVAAENRAGLGEHSTVLVVEL